ncbi:hypothetical protein GH714_040205 [Hevea brasiliensis]|uniref:Uncharacterized protein n=1 Tax=Hevea brasiliensis TaxID=3981 RepID=A0A6A6MRQ3_HEVBR|nr:hypothetical protein GH714_040205 [Hevea brasiliensis]
MKRGVSMNAGKCDPCVVVADGMIFVLSSSFVFNFTVPGYIEKRMPIDNSIRFFECFDPESNKWMVLDDLPIDILALWPFFFIGQRIIFFIGGHADGFRVLSGFNLDTLEWTSLMKVEKEKITVEASISVIYLLGHLLLDLPTLYLQGRSIIPLGPPHQHVGEANFFDDVTLIVALSENGQAKGIVFEDDGDGYEFAKGGYLVTPYVTERLYSVVIVRVSKAEG